jgi:pyruvate-ferredoxin/flavodoxin oxidoreductase
MERSTISIYADMTFAAAVAASQSYLNKYDCLSRLKPGGVLVMNATWKSAREMEAALPAKVRRQLAALAPQMYVVDARAVADAVGLGKRINMVMQTGAQ